MPSSAWPSGSRAARVGSSPASRTTTAGAVRRSAGSHRGTEQQQGREAGGRDADPARLHHVVRRCPDRCDEQHGGEPVERRDRACVHRLPRRDPAGRSGQDAGQQQEEGRADHQGAVLGVGSRAGRGRGHQQRQAAARRDQDAGVLGAGAARPGGGQREGSDGLPREEQGVHGQRLADTGCEVGREQRHRQLAERGRRQREGPGGQDHCQQPGQDRHDRQRAGPVERAVDVAEPGQVRRPRAEAVQHRQAGGEQREPLGGRGQARAVGADGAHGGQRGHARHHGRPAADAEPAPGDGQEDDGGDAQQPDAQREEQVLHLAAGPLGAGLGRRRRRRGGAVGGCAAGAGASAAAAGSRRICAISAARRSSSSAACTDSCQSWWASGPVSRSPQARQASRSGVSGAEQDGQRVGSARCSSGIIVPTRRRCAPRPGARPGGGPAPRAGSAAVRPRRRWPTRPARRGSPLSSPGCRPAARPPARTPRSRRPGRPLRPAGRRRGPAPGAAPVRRRWAAKATRAQPGDMTTTKMPASTARIIAISPELNSTGPASTVGSMQGASAPAIPRRTRTDTQITWASVLRLRAAMSADVTDPSVASAATNPARSRHQTTR